MDRDQFREALLVAMEQKVDRGARDIPLSGLHIHFEQEYETYVRDFPVLVGRAYVQCPVAGVRRELAENLYEEETGGLAAGRPHPELFLEYPRGFGMDLARFEHVELLPAARRYRAFLDDGTMNRGWEIATALTTIFVEGTRYERGELDPNAPKRPVLPLEEHPLVKQYGLSVEYLALTKAHRKVEGDHRTSAWKNVLEHVPAKAYEPVVAALEEAVSRWKSYRDDVAIACGVSLGKGDAR